MEADLSRYRDWLYQGDDMNAEERYRNEAHVLTKERDAAVAELARLRKALEEIAKGTAWIEATHIARNVLKETT